MKKWLIGLVALVVLLLIGAYIFIPKKLSIAKTNIVPANQNSIVRYFSTKTNWSQWQNRNDKDFKIDSHYAFVYNGVHFSATNKIDNGLEISIHNTDVNTNSFLTFYSLGKDSTAMEWKCEIDGGNNLFERITNYKKALYIKKNMASLLDKLQTFVIKDSNIYGVNIEHEIIKDTLVISQKADFTKYPTTAEIYKMIDQLKAYALTTTAKITNPPMMNVTLVDSVYQTMVALPIDKQVNGEGKIELKHLTPGTPMLNATVYGGNYTVGKTLLVLENYKMDHQSSSPAIPYNVLLTDRSMEPDTTKWKTKVCDLLFPWFR